MNREETESKLVERLETAGMFAAILGLRAAISVGNMYQETKKLLGETFLGKAYRNANYDGSAVSRGIVSKRYVPTN